ncbi:MAG: Hpt domain-containing protein [Brevefilum sp.]
MNPLLEIDRLVFNALKVEMGAEFMLEIVETYCDDARQQIGRLLSALDQGDAEAFTRAAHSLKSTSLSLGALAFGDLARDLETLGRAGRLADAQEIVQQVQAACEPLSRILKDLCHE